MGTYYELLAVSPGASVTEVEDAYRVGYDHWRLLVTSHDPELANRANGMLQQLETARAVLTDPQKRSAYNLSLSAEESVGGLADPTAGATPLPTLTPPIAEANTWGGNGAPSRDESLPALRLNQKSSGCAVLHSVSDQPGPGMSQM